ncbi:MAG: GHMP kinase [Lutibacter sp.]|nr:GHMP kinase [Lutibacter sp.]
MIISRTPLRMSFVGGGSDLPSFYMKHGGAVLSTTIDKYIYINVNKKFDNGIRIAYSKTEEVESIHNIEHKLVKATMELLEISGGIEITSIADIPSKGTGLGSSSSFTIGLLNALNAYKGNFSSKEFLGEQSCKIEIDICGEPIGKQDQYAAAFGGFNLIEFNKNGEVLVKPIITKKETLLEIEQNLIVFYTGLTRNASSILKEQNDRIQNDNQKVTNLLKMVDLTHVLYNEIQNNNTKVFGEILHENWELKKELSNGISNTFIDDCYNTAINSGALGGKILGAGAGGFLLFYVEKNKQKSVINSLSNLKQINFSFENNGSQIIYYK